jgi:hypothetical protein
MTARKYLSIVKTNLLKEAKKHFGDDDWIFQQDGAAPHRAKVTIEELEEIGDSRGFSLLPWPAHSPDLSPIENMWAELKTMVAQAGPARSMGELTSLVEEKIEALNAPENEWYFHHLYSSMPNRCREIISAKGWPIDS